MNIKLKKAIFDYMIENRKEFQLVNSTVDHFRQYIYDNTGNHIIGGQGVHDFIIVANQLIICDYDD